MRDFGIGTSINYGLYLYSAAEANKQANPYANISVVLPDGAQIQCACTPGADCSAYQTANLTCNQQPLGAWFDSVLTWNSATPGWDLTLKDGTVYAFGQGAPLQGIHDRYGNAITIARSNGQTGQITQISASNGRYVNFGYNTGSTLINSITDNSGRTVSYTYNNTNKTLNTVTYTSYNASSKTSYGYETAIGNLAVIDLKETNASGQLETNYNYLTYGLDFRVATFGPDLGSNGFGYTYFGSGTGYIDEVAVGLPDGTIRQFYFDANGYLTQDWRAPNTLNENTYYSRDSLERITQINDNNSQYTSYVYNAMGDVSSITQTPGPGTQYSNGSITTSFAYQGVGSDLYDELTSVTDPLGNVTSYQYDASGNLISVTDPMNRTSTFGYNPLGQLTTATTPLNEMTTYAYWPTTDDLRSVEDPLGNITNFTTDALGRVTQVATPLGSTVGYVYDAMDHVTQMTDPNGNVTSMAYDPLGLLSTITDPNGNTTTITRPQTLNSVKTCDPAGKCTVVNLDGAGKTTDFTDKRGIKTVFTYDNLQRLTNANFNSTGVSGVNQRTISVSYDSLDRPTQAADTGALNNTIGYTYDGVGNVMSENVVTTLNSTINYDYDADSRQISMSTSGTGNPQNLSYSYDNDGELTGIGGGPATVTLGYDSDGRRASLLAGAVATSYVYDKDSQLLSLNYSAGGNPLGNLAYTYDADGRVVGESGSLAALDLPQSEGPNQYSSLNQIAIWNGSAAATDANGNLTSDPLSGATLAWGSRNDLASVLGLTASFGADYDALMRRYDQHTANQSVVTTYLHDQKAVTSSATSLNGVQSGAGSASAYLTLPGTGEVLAVSITSGGATSVYVPITDRLGSTLGLVNSGNALQTQFVYDPWGNFTVGGTNPGYPYLFAGMEYDAATGYYHTQSRYYSSSYGRFISPDSILATNLYTYAGDDPVNAVDPTGMDVQVCDADCQGDQSPDYVASDNQNSGGGLMGIIDALYAIFSSIFGGGGGRSAPYIAARHQPKHNEYQTRPFIGVPYALTPDMVDSAGMMGRYILVQMEDDEDPEEEVVVNADFFQSAFAGRPTFSPTGGIWLRYNGGQFFLPGGIEGKPADNGKGLIFDLGNNMSVRIQGPATEGRYKYPTGYFRVYRGNQAIDLGTNQPGPNSLTHYELLP